MVFHKSNTTFANPFKTRPIVSSFLFLIHNLPPALIIDDTNLPPEKLQKKSLNKTRRKNYRYPAISKQSQTSDSNFIEKIRLQNVSNYLLIKITFHIL